jgi:hypothetical protein
LTTNPERPIDRAFAKIWECYHADHQEDDDTGWCSYTKTRIATLAAIRIAMSCDDAITTGYHYLPGSNEIVARLREIRYPPTAESIEYAQAAVMVPMDWEERIEGLIKIGG